MFEYWGFGHWALVIWFICYFITFIPFIFLFLKNQPHYWIYASLLVAFTWPIIWFFLFCAWIEQAQKNSRR